MRRRGGASLLTANAAASSGRASASGRRCSSSGDGGLKSPEEGLETARYPEVIHVSRGSQQTTSDLPPGFSKSLLIFKGGVVLTQVARKRKRASSRSEPSGSSRARDGATEHGLAAGTRQHTWNTHRPCVTDQPFKSGNEHSAHPNWWIYVSQTPFCWM